MPTVHVKRARNLHGTVCDKLNSGDGTSLYWRDGECRACLLIGIGEGYTKAEARMRELVAADSKIHAVYDNKITWCKFVKVYLPPHELSGNFETTTCMECLSIAAKALPLTKAITDQIAKLKGGSVATNRRISSRPHKCPKCGGAAYVGFMTTLDCERGCK